MNEGSDYITFVKNEITQYHTLDNRSQNFDVKIPNIKLKKPLDLRILG
jgi:hypothetical protein